MQKEKVYKILADNEINYEVIKHRPIFTVEEANELEIIIDGIVCKNLFLKDKKKNYYLVSLPKDKKINLSSLALKLNCSRLSFASSEELTTCLNLKKGEVTPLGIINDEKNVVNIVFDKELVGKNKIGVHPNDNSITILLSFNNLIKVIKQYGNKIYYVNI